MTSITGRSLVKMPAPNLIASPSTTVRPMPRTMLSCKVNRKRAISMARHLVADEGKKIGKDLW